MPGFTTLAFSQSVAHTGADVTVAAVPDQSARVQGNSIIVSEYNRLIGVMACIGALGTTCRMVSPSLRRKAPHYVRALNLGLVPNAIPYHDVDIGKKVPLDLDEQLQTLIVGTAGAAAQYSIVTFLANGDIAPVSGEIFTVRATVTLTPVAGEWNFAQLAFIDTLPSGVYGIVGMNVIAAAMVAARLAFVGGGPRPGCPCHQDGQDGIPLDVFRNGYLGEWGTFDQNIPPAIELLASAAPGASTFDVYLDLIKK